jgi:uncharacterized protein (DUF488 family)
MHTIYTIGHSTRSIELFVEMLKSFDIHSLVDVRSYPGSRRNPQFNKNKLIQSIAGSSITYIHLPSLGGKREPVNSPGKKHHQFQGYLDHMNSEEFKEGIKELLELSKNSRIAIMCAEGDWHKCHRSLIADYLKSIGTSIKHITGVNESENHSYTKVFRENQSGLNFE